MSEESEEENQAVNYRHDRSGEGLSHGEEEQEMSRDANHGTMREAKYVR